MRAEEIHRKKLKELGYKDEVIEELVTKYIANCTYEFAEAYQTELLNIDSVSQRSELLYKQVNWLMANTSLEVEKIVDFKDHFVQ
jgi:hypothetical protein